MKNKYDIGVRKNQKKKKDAGASLTIKCILSIACAVLSAFALIYMFINQDKFFIDEKLDLGIFAIPFPADVTVLLIIVVALVMIVSLYFSILAMHEYLRRKNNPSDLEKQLELIESQFTEKEKKVYISSKDKLKQLEQMENDTKERLKRKYGNDK